MLQRTLLLSVTNFLVIIFLSTLASAQESEEDILPGAKVLTLQSALARGIQYNLDLQVEELNIPISQENVTVDKAEFDPVIEMGISSQEMRTPTAIAFSSEDFDLYRETGGDVGIKKRFQFGLESGLSFKTNRSMNNSSVDALRPQYRNILLLDLTQPLLRDFGTGVNTANLRMSQNLVRQTARGYMDRAQRIGEEIELVYYDLAEAQEILRYRIESRELARDLLEGNKEKFEAGVVPITEVQQAETAMASRDEEVIFARQQVEIVANRLRDLLGIRPEDPFYKEPFVTEDMPGTEQTFPDFEQTLATALEKRPDIQRQHLEIAHQDIKLAYYDNQRLPRLDLEATLGTNGLSGGDRPTSFADLTVSSPQVGSYGDSLSRMSDADGYEWYAGLRFSYPLGNRGTQARYRRAGLEKRQAVYRLKRLEETAEKECKNSLVTVKRSLERVGVAERFEGLAQTTLMQEMERLKEGLSDTFRILIFQNSVIQARIRKTSAIVDFNQGLANLYRAMGTNLKHYDIVAAMPEKELVNAEEQ
ncbi:MAG: TolC family protein [Deltaproteobacteria bacterium]|nr:TolC family protein [Deltaproteobacteria bacterium]MDL1960445.1 TolC family protein [Deltaproteobacteria bacterium]